MKSKAKKEIMKMCNIYKHFPGVQALNDVSMSVFEGEVHGIVGENGAGKSTLIKILSGVYQPDEGKIYINKQPVKLRNPIDAAKQGIRVIYQELETLDDLTVMENIFLGEYPSNRLKAISWKKIEEDSREILRKLNSPIDPRKVMSNLQTVDKQIVVIARAIWRESKLVIMDEPTAALSEDDANSLFNVINVLKRHGISIIYISHRLNEVFKITDRITILRDGKKIETVETKDTSESDLITKMIGMQLKNYYPKESCKLGEKVLEIKNLSVGNRLNDVSLDLREGEVLGIFGLLGSGKVELARAIFGDTKTSSGDIEIFGKKMIKNNPGKSIDNSVGFLPSERKAEGLNLIMDIKQNITLANLKNIGKGFFINRNKEKNHSKYWVNNLNIKTPSIDFIVNNLSGGNQQKVVLSKWLEARSKLFILAEPTRGIDVGAKTEIYKIIENLCKEGVGIILVSSELPEILSISDRIVILSKGRITGEFLKNDATEEKLLKFACM